jgi:hypothetical protein
MAAQEPGEGWTKHLSPAGVPYYYNESTKVSVWSVGETWGCKRPRSASDGPASPGDSCTDSVVEDVTGEREADKRRRLVEGTVVLDGGEGAPASPKRQSMSSASKRRKSVDVDQAVEDMSEERRALQSQLSSKDAVLDPRCKSWAAQWLADAAGNPRKLQRDVDHLIDMLSAGLEGYAEYAGKLLRWIDMIGGGAGAGAEHGKGAAAAMEHFKALVLKEFSADKLVSVVENEPAPPQWLSLLLDTAEWRRLLIGLADKHKQVPLLEFGVKAICKAGLHREVAEVSSTAAYFAVFRRTLTDTMRGILDFDATASTSSTETPLAQLSKLEEKFRELAGLSQYTYMFAMEALEALEGSTLEGRQLVSPLPKEAKAEASQAAAGGAAAAAASCSSSSSRWPESSPPAPSASSSSGSGAPAPSPSPSPSPPAASGSGAPSLGISFGNQSKLRRLRQGLERLPTKNDAARDEAIALCNPVNRRSVGGLGAAAASGGSPELARLLRAFTSDPSFKPDVLAGLRAVYDPALNPAAALAPLWPLRRAEFLSLLTQQLFDPFREMEVQARRDGAYVLAVASARLPADATLGLQHAVGEGEAAVCRALDEALDICKERDTLTPEGMLRSGRRVQRLTELVREFPPVAAGLIRFSRSLILSPRFQKESCFTMGVLSLLGLVRVAMQAHPLQRVMAFYMIIQSLPISPSNVIPTRLLEIKQAMLDELVELMRLGYVFQVLEFVKNQVGQLDQVLLRHFVVGLCKNAGAPFSPEFARAALQLVNHESCSRCIRSSSKDNQRIVNEFKLRCTTAIAQGPQAHNAATAAEHKGPATPPQPAVPRAIPGTNKNKVPLALSPNPQRRETIRLVPFRPNK